MAQSDSFDYIIVGGGLAGCVLASRLSLALPSLSVALLEAGPDEHDNPAVQNPLGYAALQDTPLVWKYMSTPQKHLNGRQIPQLAGKLLSGSTGVNAGAWTRGDAANYDHWAKVVGDNRWDYAHLLPYFKRSETHYDSNGDKSVHGFEGPMHTTAGRSYPLKESVKAAAVEAGFKYNPDNNGGDADGIGLLTESWRNIKRQPAGQAYDLSKVKVLTKSIVRRIVLDEDKTATGVELGNGNVLNAAKEVIVSAGALKTPQVLMLSGVGPKDQLSRIEIPQMINAPDLGRNLFDHYSISQYFKLRHPEQDLALGSQGWNKPEYQHGNPIDWMIMGTSPQDQAKAAMETDGQDYSEICQKSDMELITAYAAIGGSPEGRPGFDGKHISVLALNLMPTSRGTITLKSADPNDHIDVDPNYLGTEHDRVVMRNAARKALQMMLGTKAGQEFVHEETTPRDGYVAASLSTSDADLDRLIREHGDSWSHSGGTAAMGKVVDTECRVIGAKKLRVVDASILPTPLSGHYQAPMYGIAECAADMIIEAAQ